MADELDDDQLIGEAHDDIVNQDPDEEFDEAEEDDDEEEEDDAKG